MFIKFIPQAKSDTIDALELYREKSIPTFLMYAVSPSAPSASTTLSGMRMLPSDETQGGALVSVIRGALGPLLEKTIKEQLSYEHEVLEGKKERVPVSIMSLEGGCRTP